MWRLLSLASCLHSWIICLHLRASILGLFYASSGLVLQTNRGPTREAFSIFRQTHAQMSSLLARLLVMRDGHRGRHHTGPRPDRLLCPTPSPRPPLAFHSGRPRLVCLYNQFHVSRFVFSPLSLSIHNHSFAFPSKYSRSRALTCSLIVPSPHSRLGSFTFFLEQSRPHYLM